MPATPETLRLARAVEDTPGLVSLYLFGSQAEGRAHRDSDLDVAVLLDRAVWKTPDERHDLRLRLAGQLSRPGGPEADVVLLDEAPPLLARRIVTRGQRVVCRDPETDHAFVRDVQLRAADLAPWLERMRRVKLEALARP